MERYWQGYLPEPSVRTVREMKCVPADPEFTDSDPGSDSDFDPERPLYYMYRDLYMNEADHEKPAAQQLRYDITVIPPAMPGREYVKTKGHYHPNDPHSPSGIGYPELYLVQVKHSFCSGRMI